ncbi:LLM class flavin-dependent oxidoreductase [Streptomyces sp. NPDC058000]|uniref:LLM class flavin-dependent oxidoreductase n=1 Tax=Streptomyces sp. NPDC058000 TaxID=3346299 RepID=UPI0036ED2C20
MSYSPARRLSVLDVAPVWSDTDGAQALHNAVDLAQQVERLGYHRYWVAEHHNTPSLATSAPAVLAGRLAAATTTLRVGSGGVLLPNHAPLVVAEQFATLEALHPGRIDLGIGRASGSDPNTVRALGRSAALDPADFPRQLQELRGYLETDAGSASPRTIAALPAPPGRPWLCMLGSSLSSARLAGQLGLPYAFAHHLVPQLTAAAVDAYRAAFRPSGVVDAPYAIVAAMAIAGETDQHAEELTLPYLLRKIRIQSGDIYGPYPTATEAKGHEFSAAERDYAVEHCGPQLFGGPAVLREKLAHLVAATDTDELMAITLVHEHAERVRSYERLAAAAAEVFTTAPGTGDPT